MNKQFLVTSISAILLNLLGMYFRLDYFWSVLLVFGGISLLLSTNAIQTFSKNNWKLFGGFFIFSNIATLFIEMLMIHFNVWGFSNRVQSLSGLLFLGYPAEEFIYWAFCPAIVALSYISFGKTFDKFVNPFSLARVAKLGMIFTKPFKNDSGVTYTKEDKTGQYSSGKKFPVYIWLQILIISVIIMLSKYYRGNKKAMLYTTIAFFLTAFPHELYSTFNGFWIYNNSALLGIYLFRIPLEGYLMYFISPIAGCMMIDIANRIFFKKDI